MNAIIGFSELLLHGGRRTPEPLQRDEFARQILDAGRSLMSLVKDILDFSSLSNTVPRLRLDWVPVEQLLHTALRAAGADAAARGVELALLPSQPLLQALVDYDKFRQILANLLGNAIKFTPAGGRIELHGCLTEQGELEVSVRDSGEGVAPEDLARALEPFVQLENSRRRQTGGAGLGLPISRQLAEAHRGRLLLESAVGAGTCAKIVLPPDCARIGDAEEPDLAAEADLGFLRSSL